MANETAENREAALMQRDAAMMLLIAQAQGDGFTTRLQGRFSKP